MYVSLNLPYSILIYLLKLMLSQNPSATNKAVDQDGWFNTGDIGWIAPRCATGPSRNCGGMLVLEGRAKDTIVLTTGIIIFFENVTYLCKIYLLLSMYDDYDLVLLCIPECDIGLRSQLIHM
jgi:hypothetical protein